MTRREYRGSGGLSVTWIVTSVACALAAVNVQDFAGQAAGSLEVHERVDDVGDLPHMADRAAGCAYVSGECTAS